MCQALPARVATKPLAKAPRSHEVSQDWHGGILPSKESLVNFGAAFRAVLADVVGKNWSNA